MNGTKSKSWREAVSALLRAAELSHAKLAQRIGLPRPNVTRWLSGSVQPNKDSIRDINKAVAQLIGDPEVETYLVVLARLDSIANDAGTDVDENEDTLLDEIRKLGHTAGRLVSEFEEFFDSDVLTTTFEDVIDRDLATMVGFSASLAHIRGRHILKRLQGATTGRPFFDEIASLCTKLGLGSMIKRDARTQILRARERARFKVDEILADASLPTSERIPLGRDLYALIDGPFSAILSAYPSNDCSQLSAIAKELSRIGR